MYNRLMTTPADIAGDNAVHALSTVGARAVWVQIVVSGAGTVRLGDIATVSATQGIPIPAGGSQFLPYKGNLQWYALQQLGVYIPAGATVSFGYEI